MVSSIATSDVIVKSQIVYDGDTGSTGQGVWNGTRSSIGDIIDLDPLSPLTSFVNLLRFLSSTNIRILDPTDIDREGTEGRGRLGSSMEVFSGRHNNTLVALKYFKWPRREKAPPEHVSRIVSRYRQSMYDLLFELKVMTHEPLCSHRNITRAFGVTFDEKLADIQEPSLMDLVNPVVVVEHADPKFPDLGEFFKVIPGSTLTFEVLGKLISDVAEGIAVLHEYGIVHSDIKPGNILIFSEEDGFVAKIGDFGAAGLETTNDRARGFTRYWAAPECLEDCPLPGVRQMSFGKAHDVYSFGLVTAFIMLLGESPLPMADEKGRSTSAIKFDDDADDIIQKSIEKLWNEDPTLSEGDDQVRENLALIHGILEETVRLFPNARLTQLNSVRLRLLGSWVFDSPNDSTTVLTRVPRDPYASAKRDQKFVKRPFTEREDSVLGVKRTQSRKTYLDTKLTSIIKQRPRKEDSFDIMEVEARYSVYPNLPEFLLPILKKTGMADLPSTKYFPRTLLSDQPIIGLYTKSTELDEAAPRLEREADEALRKALEAFQRQQDQTDADRENFVAGPKDRAAIKRFSEITHYGGDIVGFAMLMLKLRLCPPAGAPWDIYEQFRGKLTTEFDPEIFTVRDPRLSNKTFFHAACLVRDTETAQFLLDHGADINAVDDEGRSPWLQTFLEPFHILRMPGLRDIKEAKDVPPDLVINVAQFLVSRGARTDFEFVGIPLLHLIEAQPANANKPVIIDFLIRHGHPVDVIHPRLGSPLNVACTFFNEKSAGRLLRLGADPNGPVPDLSLRAGSGQLLDKDDAGQKYLATLSRRVPKGLSLVESIAHVCLRNTQLTVALSIFEMLLQHGADLYPRAGQMGWTDAPMAHVFLLMRRVDMLRILLRYKPEFVRSCNSTGHTPLSIAAFARNIEAVQLLIDHGADVNAISLDGTRPYMAAFANNGTKPEDAQSPGDLKRSIEVARLLQQHGADITARRSWRFAPPLRLYFDTGAEDPTRVCTYSAADDGFITSPDMWLIRRNLDFDLAASGNSLFLKPSKLGGAIVPELIIPVITSTGALPWPGHYGVKVRLGVLSCQHNAMIASFAYHGRDQEDYKTLGLVITKLLRSDTAYELVFPHTITLKSSSSPSILSMWLSHEEFSEVGTVAGLFLDWIELFPIPSTDELRVSASRTESDLPELGQPERVLPVADLVPTGVRKAMSDEPVARGGGNPNMPRSFEPLSMFASLKLSGQPTDRNG